MHAFVDVCAVAAAVEQLPPAKLEAGCGCGGGAAVAAAKQKKRLVVCAGSPLNRAAARALDV